MAAAHVLLHWNNNLGYFSTLYLRLFLNQVVLIWIAHIRMTQLVVGTRVKYSVYGGKKRAEYYGTANIIISSVAISTRSPSFVALSPVTDYIAFWGERSRLSPPEYPPLRWAGAGYTWLPECAAQCPARALPHAVLMMPVPSPAPAQPSNIPTISYISAALQPAATCCKLLMQIFDKCIWSILLWVGTSRQAATFSFNHCQAFILYLSQSSMYAILCKQWAIECWVRAK